MVFGGLDQYYDLAKMHWTTAQKYYYVYDTPTIDIFKQMINRNIVGQF